MFLLAGLASLLAASILATNIHVTRYDVSYDEFHKKSITEKTFITTVDNSQTSFLTAPLQTPIKVVFDCDPRVPTASCTKAQNAYASVVARISASLQFTTQIIVRAFFRPFCGSIPNCPNKGTLGLAAPNAFFVAQPSDTNNSGIFYQYPQALVKQLNHNLGAAAFNDFDIFSEFNSEFDFWFKDDPPITPSQYDFEYAVVHEITHGLGFFPQWELINLPTGSILGPGVQFPPGANERNNLPIQGWSYNSIFDRFIISKSPTGVISSLATKGDVIRTTVDISGKTFRNVLPLFDAQSESTKVGVEIFKLSTAGPNSLFLDLGENKTLVLNTPKIFTRGSSLSHLDLSVYEYTPDFMMTPSAKAGKTLDIIIKNNTRKTGSPLNVYGPLTIKLFEKMGYSTSNSLTVGSITIKNDPNVNGIGIIPNSVFLSKSVLINFASVAFCILII